jgi:hypothetical protein
LNKSNVGLVDAPFPDSNGRHVHCISEMNSRRQKKMHGGRKKLGRNFEGL